MSNKPAPKPSFVEKDGTCLMITTSPDKRRLFTKNKNFPMLIEFAKTSGAELSVIRPQESIEVMELTDLTRFLCDPNYTAKEIKFDVVEQKIAPIVLNPILQIKTPIMERSANRGVQVKEKIREMLASGQTVSLQSITKEFESIGLSASTLCNYYKQVREQMASEGVSLLKVKRGTYRLAPEKKKTTKFFNDEAGMTLEIDPPEDDDGYCW